MWYEIRNQLYTQCTAFLSWMFQVGGELDVLFLTSPARRGKLHMSN